MSTRFYLALLAGLITLLGCGSKASAAVLSPIPEAALVISSGRSIDIAPGKSHEPSIESWAPYLREFSEVGELLLSPMRERGGPWVAGSGVGFSCQLGTGADTTCRLPLDGSDNPLASILQRLSMLLSGLAGRERSETGSSASPRLQQTQIGILTEQDDVRSHAVTRLSVDTAVIAGTPYVFQILRPPRSGRASP